MPSDIIFEANAVVGDMPTGTIVAQTQADQLVNEYDTFVINHYDLKIPNRGGNFLFPLHCQAPSERSLYSQELVADIPSDTTDQGVLQVFRASQDNIHSIKLAISAEAGAPLLLDDFEYADSQAAQAVYVSTDPAKTKVSVSSTIFQSGSKSLHIAVDRRRSRGDQVRSTFSTPQDWSNYEGLQFDWRAALAGSDLIWTLVLSDGVSEAFIQFSAQRPYQFESRTFPFEAFSNIALLDMTHITFMYLSLDRTIANANCYFDAMYLYGNEDNGTNTTALELYHFGGNPVPTTLGTPLIQDDGGTEHIAEPPTLKSVIEVPSRYGSHRLASEMVIGDYYGFLVKRPPVGSISLWGNNEQSYNSGKVYRVDATGNCIEVPGSLGFGIFTVPEQAKLKEMRFQGNFSIGSSSLFFYIVNAVTGATKYYAELDLRAYGDASLNFSDSLPEHLVTSKEDIIYLHYQDAADSEADNLSVHLRFHYNDLAQFG